ncbi:MAG: hypothetical protein LBN42_04650, partial [Oscillospiraceae bacterium]|nr:hypothetical protein [Oscillospiraceae bacterium]
MAAIPQISTGGIGRGSSDTNNLGAKKRDAGLEQRDIIGLERGEYARPPIRNKTNGADIGEGDKRREFLPMTVRLAKNPVLAVESLRQFVNNELISIAKLNGYTDLYNELETLNKTLYLPPEDIVGEILYQEKNNTTFADEALFDLLRPLAKAADSLNNDNMKDTLGLFLRSVNFVQNNDEVLKSVASNLRFLSGYFKPRPDLSENLAELSKQWDSQNAEGNFRLLRTETLALLENVNRSLIANDRTQILIPLIVHNISRYNTNASMITDSFANLLSFVPGEAKRKELIDAFTEFATKMFPEGIPKDDTPYIPSKRRLFGSGNNVAKELLNAKLGTAEQSGKAGQTGQSQNAQNTRETRQGNVNNNVNNNEIIRTVDNGGNIRYTDQDGNDLERFTDDKGNIRFADKNGNVLDNTGNRVDENGNRIDNNGNRVDNNGNPILPPEPRTGAPRLIGVYLSVPHVAEEVRESGLNFAEPAEILSGEIAVAKTSPPEEEVLRRAFAAVTETLEPLLPNEFPERIPESIMRELDKFAPNRQSELPQKLLQQMPQELAETPKTPNALLRAELTVIKNSQTPIAEMVNYMNDTLKFMPDIPARLSVY